MAAVFKDGKIVPRWFIWNGRRITVVEVTYRWESEAGEVTLKHFSASDGANLYELCFDTASMIWRLKNVYCEG